MDYEFLEKMKVQELKNYLANKEKKRPLVFTKNTKSYQQNFPQSILHTAVRKAKVDFVRELNSTKIVLPKKSLSISDAINSLTI